MKMSLYTIQLRWLIEGNYDLGLQNYPIFDEAYREELNNKIVQHYYFREIGFETEALFKNRLNEKMNMIMPYFNQLYESAKLEINPLKPYNITETEKRTADTTAESTANSTSEVEGSSTNSGTNTTDYGKVDKFSDTAQAQTSQNEILNDKYLTNATVTDGQDKTTTSDTGNSTTNATGTTTGNNKANVKEDTTMTRIGNIGNTSESELLELYRKTFLNIDKMVIDELSDLFMTIW